MPGAPSPGSDGKPTDSPAGTPALLREQGFHNTAHFTVAELGFGLSFELRLRYLDRDDCRQSLTHIVTRQVVGVIFDQSRFAGIVIDNPSERTLKAGFMRSAFVRVDIICKE